jgi:hypothetical protein
VTGLEHIINYLGVGVIITVGGFIWKLLLKSAFTDFEDETRKILKEDYVTRELFEAQTKLNEAHRQSLINEINNLKNR